MAGRFPGFDTASVDLDADEPTAGTLVLPVAQPGRLTLTLTAAERPGGGPPEALEVLTVDVAVMEDRLPEVALDADAPLRLVSTERATVLRFEAYDDLGLAGAGELTRGVNALTQPLSPLPMQEPTAASDPRVRRGVSGVLEVRLDGPALGLLPGDAVRGSVVVLDRRPAELGGPQRSLPAAFGVLAVTEEELSEHLRATRRMDQLLSTDRALEDAVGLLEAERAALAEAAEALQADRAALAAAAGSDTDAASQTQRAEDVAARTEAWEQRAARLAAASAELAEAFEDSANDASGYDAEAPMRDRHDARAEALRQLESLAREAAAEPDGPEAPRPATDAVAAGGGSLADAELRQQAEDWQRDAERLAAADELLGLRDELLSLVQAQRALAERAAAMSGLPDPDEAAAEALAENQAAVREAVETMPERLRAACEAAGEIDPALEAQAQRLASTLEELGVEPGMSAAESDAAAGRLTHAAEAMGDAASTLEQLLKHAPTGPASASTRPSLCLTEQQVRAALEQMRGNQPGSGPGGQPGAFAGSGRGGYLAAGSGLIQPGTPSNGRATAEARASLRGMRAALASGGEGERAGGLGGDGTGAGFSLSVDVAAERLDVEGGRYGGALRGGAAGVATRYREDAKAYLRRLAEVEGEAHEQGSGSEATPGGATP